MRAERLRVAAPRFGSRIARRLDFDSEFDCEFEFASDYQWIPVSAWFVFFPIPVGLWSVFTNLVGANGVNTRPSRKSILRLMVEKVDRAPNSDSAYFLVLFHSRRTGVRRSKHSTAQPKVILHTRGHLGREDKIQLGFSGVYRFGCGASQTKTKTCSTTAVANHKVWFTTTRVLRPGFMDGDIIQKIMKLGNNRARLVLLSALLSLLPAVVQAQFMFITNADNTITITGYTGSNGVVIIPGAIEGLPVTSIGDWAFYSASFNNILIPDSVTKIGDGAFFDSESLTNVTIGSSVAIIGDWTFGFCSSLTTVSCRGDVPSLGGNNVFYGNASTIYYLSDATGWELTFAGHPAVQWNPEVPFNFTTNNGTITITGYTGSDETATIPNKINFLPVTSIGDLVFNENTALTNVVIPDSVTSIGNDAFRFCTHLASVMIPNAVTHIGDFAFDFCEKLSSVTISENVTNLGEYAFYDCSSLTSLTIPDSVTSIKDYTFAQCTGLTNVALGHGVGRIGSTAFQMCVGLTSITIPSCVTTIESGAFIDCTGLTNVTLLNGITSIGNNAFAECSSLTSITIPQSVIWIGIEAFGHCDGLTALVVDANNSFFSSMAGVLFNKSQTLLVAFPGGKAGSYTIPESVTNIGGSAFEYCTKLTNVMIPNHVNSIAERAFLNCTSLNSLTISQSATYIGSYAFAYCAKLKAIYFKGNIPDFVGPNILLYSPATVYFLPYTTGWNMTFAGRPAVLWNPQAQTNSGSFGLLTNQFGFTVVGSSNLVIMVEASTNLASPVWLPMQTITLTNGSAYFSDPQWPNYSGRFYRLRSP